MTDTSTAWASRFVTNEIKWADPTDLLANPNNARRHPADQREAIIESLTAIGWVGVLTVNVVTNHLLDGHGRVEEAISAGCPLVPFVEVSLTEDEERRFLASYDQIGALAIYDAEIAADLFSGFVTDDSATSVMLRAVLDDLPPVPVLDDDRGTTRMGKTPNEREDSYQGSGLRSIILVYPEAEYAEMVEHLAEVRSALSVEDNAAAVRLLVLDAV
jgi:hypothetical protein